jgi:periplasmic copper chaperone A
MTLLMRKIRLVAALMLAASAAQAQHAGGHHVSGHNSSDQAQVTLGPIGITAPWSRATPASAKVAGGFFILKNQGEPDTLISVAAPDIAGRVEMHETTLTDGIMRMREKEGGIPLPSNATTAFKPGGLHVMFMDLKHPLKAGERFKADLVFAKAGKVTVEFNVRAIGTGTSANH